MPATSSIYLGDHNALQKARPRFPSLMIVIVSVLLFLANIPESVGSPDGVLPTIKKAVAVIKGPVVEGTVYFTQDWPLGSPVIISGELKNIAPNAARGFHVHEFGDATNGCISSGTHYNPTNTTHGAPQDYIRHVGDLGNVRSNASGVAVLDISDNVISLNGPFSIIGRTIVIHEGTDDLGKGHEADSLTTGHAGGRAGCGVIGIAAS